MTSAETARKVVNPRMCSFHPMVLKDGKVTGTPAVGAIDRYTGGLLYGLCQECLDETLKHLSLRVGLGSWAVPTTRGPRQ